MGEVKKYRYKHMVEAVQWDGTEETRQYLLSKGVTESQIELTVIGEFVAFFKNRPTFYLGGQFERDYEPVDDNPYQKIIDETINTMFIDGRVAIRVENLNRANSPRTACIHIKHNFKQGEGL